MKKYYALAAVIILVLFAAIYSRNSKTADIAGNENVVLFYSKECPHCQIVEEYIEKNKIAEKVNFTRAEVFYNKNNRKLFIEKYKACGLADEKEMGVPMLWAEGKCFIGQDKAIEYFQSKAK